ncbi:DEAD/DEAH box helicase [Halarcobacter ebronensis]|uniref:DEAD/DEAH box helicase n=1 Tax=Halarcobacter ebronensis TaxID=1462615 RepID=UPI003C76930A
MIPSVLASQLITGVKDFLTTTFPSTTEPFHNMMNDFVKEEGNLYKGPYISVSLPFKKGVSNLNHFPDILDDSFNPYYHQELAFQRLKEENPKPTLVATGTGSGKTESFMFPILNHCLKTKNTKGIKAIIIYPMNALATDQAKRFAKEIAKRESLKDVRVGLYIGSSEDNPNKMMTDDYVITDKYTLADNPPDILLTNYKMLDFMLMRPKDQKIWKHNISTDVLKFITVDEIHTFDGAQGTDLASLMRRLRAKLEVKKGTIACVGTSATLGGDTTEPIREFASNIFDEEFDEKSVVKEYRLNADEFFENSDDEILFYPMPPQIKQLEYKNYKSVADYIKTQYLLWFNEEIEDINSAEFKVELGKKLKKLYFFKLMLKTLDGKIKSQNQIIDVFIRKIPIQSGGEYFIHMINSLLALTSWAKNEKLGNNYPPFLFVRVQVWLRELARMVGSLDETPVLTYSDDLKAGETTKHYPVIHCRDCHATGWAGVRKDGTSELLNDLDLFYQAFFSNDPRVKYIFPCDENSANLTGRTYFINKSGFEIVDKEDEQTGLKVYEPKNIDSKGKNHSDCPYCNSKNSLTILGSRAASLTSVLIGQKFASYYNDDKKLIAFSDSVQDSAQRAGFFGARSYQFTIRSAIQQALNNYNKEVPLINFGKVVSDYWKSFFNDDKQYISTLIAPDMEWLREYDNLVNTDELKDAKDLIDLIDKRIDWMIHSEYGFKSHIGRTLERSNASVMYIDDFELILDELLIKMQNDFESLRKINKEDLEKFIFGILLYFKNNGAINSFHVEPYIKSGGETYQINQMKPRMLYMAKFSPNSRNPKFISSGSFKAFEKVSNKTNTTWFDRWLACNFMDDSLLLPNSKEVYRVVFEYLVKNKILLEDEVKDNAIWMLNSQNLFITNKTKEFKCNCCDHKLTINEKQENIVNNMSCLRKECFGKYTPIVSEDSYYKQLYSTGDLQRIVAREHTGLLSRDAREKVENNFINRKPNEPWKTNLLSATPTLEMGIDIGDLSSVILCSVPPNGANYLQRIGRAGRTDGNAFNATVANAGNHDLYFYEDPYSIMQGSIDAPGVYIDASAILQRQFLAYSIDNWVTKENIQDKEFPNKLNTVLSNISKSKKDRFPYTLFDFIEKNKEELLIKFFSLYGDKLHQNSKEELNNFVKGVDESNSLVFVILNRLNQMINEQSSLSNSISALKKKIKLFEKEVAQDKDHEKKLKEMNSELSGLKSVLVRLRRKMTFEFFADEGLLPNYAFPESGVVLKSVIYRRKETLSDESGGKYETFTYEYERAGSSAISELAPTNSFYAGGRKVTIDQIDMSQSEAETWRFCDKCSYCQKETHESINSCPKCGSEMFGDSGQKKEILRMTQVLATSDDKSSRLKDDKDQRDVKFFNKQLLINFDKKNIEDAYAVNSDITAFGFEFIKRVNFKEINFGETTLLGNDIAIAGKSVPRSGFVICKDCGKVQFGKPNDEKFKGDNHSFTCEIEDKKDPNSYYESLYLFREFDSEAIRLLLPISSMNIDEEKLHSLIASFQLGLKEYFKGSVEHLKVGIYDEVDNKDEYSKRFLILYDTVPGGTGYLKQLMIDEQPLFEVLEVALNKLQSCSCNKDHNKDGCYQCLYAYKNNFDRPLISKRKAMDIIENILASKDSISKVDTVSDIKADSLSESILEELFLSKIKSVATNFKQVITSRGRSGYLVEVNKDNIFEIEQQVELSEKDGIPIYTKADFIIYPIKNKEIKPIVVFTDGFAYHEDRIDMDSTQRMAIVKSGNYHIWSLTWEDIEEFDKKQPDYKYLNFISEGYVNLKILERMFKNYKEYDSLSNFELLIKFLNSDDINIWKKLSHAVSASMIKAPISVDEETIANKISKEMQEVCIDFREEYFGGYVDSLYSFIGALALKENLTKANFEENINIIYLKDNVNDMEFSHWAGALRLYNLLQFMTNSFFTSSKGIENDEYNIIDFDIKENSGFSKEWQSVYEEVLDEVKELVKEISSISNILSIPIVGEEIVDSEDNVIAEAELLWEDIKVAVTLEEKIELEGWSIFTLEQKDQIINTLKEKVKQ